MHRYWITFDGSDMEKRLLRVDRGIGVTAHSLNDALSILDEELWRGGPGVPISTIIEDVDVSTLDKDHVIPNMALPLERGIWFPLGHR